MGGGRSRFKISYRRRFKGGNILSVVDGKCEVRVGFACKLGYCVFRRKISFYAEVVSRVSIFGYLY